MSVNCFSMPFRFTIMVAARTACGVGGGVTGAAERCPDAHNPDPPGVGLNPSTWAESQTMQPPPAPEPDNLDRTLTGSNS